ncbi:MAG: radical SAM protein [Candidatus Omnitrophota bacterium]
MKVALVVCPSHHHILGVGYINAVLRKNNHKVIPFDLEFLFEAYNQKLFSRFIPLTMVYQEKAINKVHFFLRPEIIFSSLFGTSLDMRKNSIPKEEREMIGSVKKYIPIFSELILKSQPEIILFSTTVMNLIFSLLLAQNLKKKTKGMPIIFGGVGVSTKQVQEVILRLKIVDYCILGEGEEVIIDLLRKVEAGIDVSKTPRVACLVKERFSYQPHVGMVDLDSLPYPNFDDFPFPGANIKLYAKSKASFQKQFIPIAASRWCAKKCVFCFESNNKQKYRIRKVESVIDEIISQSKKYKSDSFWLYDSTFNINLAWLERFCDLIIKENISVRFKFAHLYPKHLSFKLLNKMRQAGFEFLSYGVESFSSKLLNNLSKYNDVNEMKRILIDTARNKIKHHFGLIYNLPGQKKEDIYKNMDEILSMEGQLRKLKIDNAYFSGYSFTPLRIDPHSAVFKNIKKYGIRLSPYRLHLPPKARHIEGLINKTLFNWETNINLEDTVRSVQKFLDLARFKTMSRYSKSVTKRSPLL